VTTVDPLAQWEQPLRPWRWAYAFIDAAQLVSMVAVLAFVFLVDESYKAWAYTGAAAIVLLELAQWALAREALRRIPGLSGQLAVLYSSLPLDHRQRRHVTSSLVLFAVVPALLVVTVSTISSDSERVIAAVLTCVAMGPGFLSLYRVRRHNSWLAVSRLGGRPRHPPQGS